MNHQIKLFLPTVLIALTTSICADTDEEIMALKQRVKVLEQKKEGCNRVTPPARPDVRDGADLFITADALYWKAEEDGLEFVEKQFEDIAFPPNYTNGKILNPHFDWNWGFRVGLGYNTPHDGWDLYLNWVRFKSRGHEDAEVNPPAGIASQTLFASNGFDMNDGGNSDDVQRAETDWHLKLNLLDFELGREFFVSKWLTLRPFAGL